MLNSRFLSGLAAVLLACSFRAQADIEAIRKDDTATSDSADAIVIDGDKLELQLDRKMHASGNASISKGTQKVFGDVIDYDEQNDELHVVGNVRLDLGNTKLSGPELRMQLSTNIGEIKDAKILVLKPATANAVPPATRSSEAFSKNLGNLQSQQVGGESIYSITSLLAPSKNLQTDSADALPHATQERGDAKAIFFEGQDKKRLKDARYTTCAVGVDDWYIKAKELEINDYTDSGVGKHAYIEFKGVPLLYTPWVSFSFNSQRKSGILAPTYGTTTKSGFEATMPFYWNISPNMDATIAARVLSKRGVQLQGEFRYLEETFSGIDNLEYLPSDNLNQQNRYYANLRHQQTLGKGWSAGYRLEKVSDDEYFADLSTHIVTTSRINLPQQLNLDYADATWRFNALAEKFQTLDKASYPYERLPQLTLTGNQYLGGFTTNLYTQLVAFNRNQDAPTAVTATRFTLYPSISYPINKTYGFLTPKFGVHHTSYHLNNDPNKKNTQERNLPIASIDGGLFFDREFKAFDTAYTQTIEPRLFYVYIPETKQSDLPVFDTSESDLNFSSLFSENQYSGNDRINNANQLSLSMTTRLIESDSGTQRISASLGQRFYFANQKEPLFNGAALRTSNSSDIIAGLSTNLQANWNADAFWQYNTDDSRAVRTTVTSRYNPEPGKVLNLSYSYRRDSLDQIDISGQWPLGRGWYGIGRTNYSIRDDQVIEALAGLEYDAGCWQTRTVLQRVSNATTTANYALFFQLELGGLASIGANPLAVIRRNIPGYVSTGLIPDTYQQPYYE